MIIFKIAGWFILGIALLAIKDANDATEMTSGVLVAVIMIVLLGLL